MGAVVIDADAISRSATAAGGIAMEAIGASFGCNVVRADGALDRDRMRELVFADPTAKARLEAIVHPLVAQAIAQQTQDAERTGVACMVFDIPLLVESGHGRQILHRILVIDCPEETQIARVMTRSALTPSEVRSILAAQATRAARLAAADLVLFNEGISLEQLTRQVHELGAQFGL